MSGDIYTSIGFGSYLNAGAEIQPLEMMGFKPPFHLKSFFKICSCNYNCY